MKLQFTAIEWFRMDALSTPATDLHVLLNSSHLAVDSGHLAGGSGHLPSNMLGELRDMAKPVADSGKASGELIMSVIAALCRGRYLTAQQMAGLLNRNTEGLRKRFLTPMTREGKLHLRYPESPNRPDQAYTTVDAP